ncbi:MAG: hypothetical protein MUC97_00580 [Bernardetiaceae bacterium]|jgi:hypothetical protein|nr:hypothetical protein [Bernardetiaceae bacterium]
MTPLSLFRFTWLVGLLIVVWQGPALAQTKRGEPNLEPYKAEIKKARQGDVAAILAVGALHQAAPMDVDEIKDYKGAAKWYLRALNPKYLAQPAQLFEAKFQLFQLYFFGGYGLKPNPVLAQQYFNEALALRQPAKYFDYQPNLFLKDFYAVYQQAQTGDPAANLHYARLLHEFDMINHHEAINALAKAAVDPDAAYLQAKWQAMFEHYRAYGHSNLDKARHFEMMQQYQQRGSQIAWLEWPWLARQVEVASLRLDNEKAYQLLAKFPAVNPEMKFKSLVILERYQKGIPRLITLRQLAAVTNHGLDETGLAPAAGLLKEFAQFDGKTGSIEGLGKTLDAHPDTQGQIQIDQAGLRQGFGGQVKPFLALQRQLSQPVVKELAGPAKYDAYQKQLRDLVDRIVSQVKQPVRLVSWERALKADPWLQPLAAQYQGRLAQRFLEFGIDSTNLVYYHEMANVDELNFKSLDHGKRYVADMLTRLPLPAPAPPKKTPIEERKLILAQNERTKLEQGKLVNFAKKKVIGDVIGPDPSVSEIERLNKMVQNDPWMQPEGSEKYFEYTATSTNWFSGQIQRGNILYYYRLIRRNPNDKFQLEIYQVANDESNLVFNAQVKAFGNEKDRQFEVHVYNARHKVYTWVPSERDYLKVTYRADGDRIDHLPVGNVAQCVDRNHGYAPDFASKKINPDEFTEQAAIRSAVQCFILEYNRALRTI